MISDEGNNNINLQGNIHVIYPLGLYTDHFIHFMGISNMYGNCTHDRLTGKKRMLGGNSAHS